MRVQLYAIALLTAAGISRPADGQIWTGNSSGSWNNGANWTSFPFLPTSGIDTSLTFRQAGSAGFITLTNNLASNPFLLNRLTFTTTAPAYAIVGNGLDFRANGTFGPPRIELNSPNSVTINNPIIFTDGPRVGGSGNLVLNGSLSGPAGIVRDDSGTLTLGSASNTYGGGTLVNGVGSLVLGVGNAIPTGGNVTIVNGGQFRIGGVSNTPATAIGILRLDNGTLLSPSGSGQYYLNKLVIDDSGGTVDFSGSNMAALHFVNSGARISVLSNSNWTGGTGSQIRRTYVGESTDFYVRPGVTLTNSFSLADTFDMTGGGTWYQAGGTIQTINIKQGGRFRFDVPAVVVDAYLQLFDGTLQYGGATATVDRPLDLYQETGAVEVTNAATVLTWSGNVRGDGSGRLVKSGAGTLALINPNNLYSDGTTVQQGVLQVTGDGCLGPLASEVTVHPFGTIRYAATGTTTRTFSLLGGSFEVPAGVTLVLNGAGIGGGFLRGTGLYALTGGAALAGNTSSFSTNLSVLGPATFTNFTHNGNLTVAAGQTVTLTNSTVGSGGRMTANGTANVSDLGSNGQITIPAGGSVVNPAAASSGIVLGGGSTTFIGTPAVPGGVLNVGPQPTLVRGGLLVNNGVVGNNTGNGIVIVDYGGLAKGTGYYDTIPQTINGGKFSPGNSPGRVTVGSATLNPGGNYDFEINNATGTAGPTGTTNLSGWDLTVVNNQINAANSNLTVTATPQNPFTFNVITLRNPSPPDVADAMVNFNPNVAQRWLAFEVNTAGSVTNWDPTAVAVNTSQVVNSLAGSFALERDATNTFQFYLTYTPVPEPGGVLAAAGLASVLAGTLRRVRKPSEWFSLLCTLSTCSPWRSSPFESSRL